MKTTTKHMTADQLLELPRGMGATYELRNGNLIVSEPAGQYHGWISASTIGSLFAHVTTHKLGRVFTSETGFLVSRNPDTVLAPDAAFVSRARAEIVNDKNGYFPGAPDLAVEVKSHRDSRAKVEAKANEWLDAGARMVIVVDPANKSATVYRPSSDSLALTGDDVLDGYDVVPGWSVRLSSLFE